MGLGVGGNPLHFNYSAKFADFGGWGKLVLLIFGENLRNSQTARGWGEKLHI